MFESALTFGVRALDTSYSYFGFRSHQTIVRKAADLLPEFAISTKVGFFAESGNVVTHSLDPKQLREAIHTSVDTLTRRPTVVFLHNPELSLLNLGPQAAHDKLADSCRALADAAREGLCQSWGIASWDTRVLKDVLLACRAVEVPTPTVLMVRSGLSVPSDVIDASETVTELLGEPRRWGMSPFGGDAKATIWDEIDARQFLHNRQDGTSLQTAFRLAYELPWTSRVAVGTDNPQHLSKLVAAVDLRLDYSRIRRYRELLRSRQGGPTGSITR